MENSSFNVIKDINKKVDSLISNEESCNVNTEIVDIKMEPIEQVLLIKSEPQNFEPEVLEPVPCEPDVLSVDPETENVGKQKEKIVATKVVVEGSPSLLSPKKALKKRRPLKKTHHCDQCPYTTIRKYDLLKHMPVHQGVVGRYQCDYCPRGFNQKSSLDSHLFTNHKHLIPQLTEVLTSKIHTCPKCPYQSVRFSDLKSHMFVHDIGDKMKKFSCEFCNYESYRRGDIRRHLRKHTAVKRFTCEICSRGFNEKIFLDNHRITIHNAEKTEIARKVYECPHCQFKAVIMTQFKRHVIAHHSDSKPFMCGACDMGFQSKKLLDSHILSSHEMEDSVMLTITNTIHACQFCEYRTLRKNSLKVHLKQNHISKVLVL